MAISMRRRSPGDLARRSPCRRHTLMSAPSTPSTLGVSARALSKMTISRGSRPNSWNSPNFSSIEVRSLAIFLAPLSLLRHHGAGGGEADFPEGNSCPKGRFRSDLQFGAPEDGVLRLEDLLDA